MRRAGTVLLLIPASALAQTEPVPPSPPNVTLPDVVVTATREPTSVLDIPAGVSVVDRQTIEVRDYTDLVQALAPIPGIYVAQSGARGGNASVFIRGTNSNHVLVLRDGMPLNDASDSSGAFNFGIGSLADVERIEIIRGPMAALYGSGAIGGVINLISRRGAGEGPHFEGSLQGGYPAAIVGDATVSGVSGPLDYAATYQGQSLQGYDPTPRRESIYSGEPQGFRTQVGTINLGFTPVVGTRISAFARAQTATFGFNTLGSPTFDDANSTGNVISLLGRVGVSSHLLDGMVQTELYAGRLQESRHYTEPLLAQDPNQASSDLRYFAYRTDVQWNNIVHLSDRIGVPAVSGLDLTFGYQYTGDAANVKVQSTSFGFPFAQNVKAGMDTNAIYAGLQGTLWNRLTLTSQIRQDWVLNDTPFTWRLGGVLNLREIATHIKAAYGTAFRAPSLFDRFGVDSSGFVGNPLLKPEQAQGWEVGFVTDVPAFARSNFLTLGATYFNNQVRNLITTVFTPVDTAVNIGSAHIHGVESEIAVQPSEQFGARLAYTYTDARDGDTNSQLLRRPQNTFSLTAMLRPTPKLAIAPEVLYTGTFRDFLVDDTGTATANVVTSKSGLLVNLTATYTITPQVSIFASGYNLTNSRFEPVNGYRVQPTWFLAGVRVRL
ncbi:MAG: TonB-dependent receptor [Acetobacteraceae bacterium]|nr:TonB-dependent receptor [Acetobacteraceae bacterium]